VLLELIIQKVKREQRGGGRGKLRSKGGEGHSRCADLWGEKRGVMGGEGMAEKMLPHGSVLKPSTAAARGGRGQTRGDVVG